MIELQLLNKVLKEGKLDIIKNNNLSHEYFLAYPDEYNFICSFEKEYNKLPDKETFLSKFTTFELLDVTETDQYLVATINEEHLYYKSVGVINKVAELLSTNSHDAVQYMLSKIPELTTTNLITGVDIIKDATSRFDSYISKQSGKSKSVILTGLEELDKLLFGWMPGEELVTVLGRTNQGKSWLLLQFLTAAWKQGKRVGLYSGEMSPEKLGYRFDTLFNHFSNTNLLRGQSELDYEGYINSLRTRENPFVIITPKELGGRATVSKICNMIEKYKLDIVGIDQYSLMLDERSGKGDQLRTQLDHISSDLFDASMKYSIPIIGLVQANRSGAVNKESEGTPELEHISESDAIAHNSSRVLSMRQSGAGLEISIKKNREGRVGDKLIYYWDIDRGNFKYIPHSEGSTAEPGRVAEIKKEFFDGKEVF